MLDNYIILLIFALMKKHLILSFILLLLLVFFSLTNYLGYRIIQKKIRSEVKHKIKSGISDKELIKFSFSKSEYEKIKWTKDDEFIFDGHFYDVVSNINSGNNIILKVFGDFQEEELFKDLDKITKGEVTGNRGEKSLKLIKGLCSIKYICNPYTNFKINFTDLSPKLFPFNLKWGDSIIETISPPPQSA